MEHIIGVKSSLHEYGEALPTEFVDDRQHLDGTTIVCAVCHKVIRPDVVAMGRP
jgi:NAD-dependent SIR2 family protein deacetylase